MAFLSVALLAGLNHASPIITVNTDFQASFFSLSAQLQDICRCPSSGLDSEPTCQNCNNCFGSTPAPRSLSVTTTKAPECKYCLTLYSPICGDDGVTYTSQCDLDFNNCKKGKSVKAVSNSVCPTTAKATTPKATTPKATQAVSTTVAPSTKSLSALQVLCLPLCPLVVFPVCGSDGKTYPNYCFLARERCLNSPDLELSDPRTCRSQATVSAPLTNGDSPTRRSPNTAETAQLRNMITNGGGLVTSASSSLIVFSSGSASPPGWSNPSISSDDITNSVNAIAPTLLNALCTCSSTSSSTTPKPSSSSTRSAPAAPAASQSSTSTFDELAQDILNILLPPFAPPTGNSRGGHGRGLTETACDPVQQAQCVGSPDDAAVNTWDPTTCTCNPQSGGSAVTNPQDCVTPCVALGLCSSPSADVSASDVALAQCLTCVRDCFLLAQKTGSDSVTTVAPPAQATTTTAVPATTVPPTNPATVPPTTPRATAVSAVYTTKQPAASTTPKPAVTTTKKPAATTTKKPIVATAAPKALPCCTCPVSSSPSGTVRITGLVVSSSTTITSSNPRSSPRSSPSRSGCESTLKNTLDSIFRDGASSTASSHPSSSSWSNFVSGMYREHEGQDRGQNYDYDDDNYDDNYYDPYANNGNWGNPNSRSFPLPQFGPGPVPNYPQPAGLPGQPRNMGPQAPFDFSLYPSNAGYGYGNQPNSRSFEVPQQGRSRVTTAKPKKTTTAKPKKTTPKPKGRQTTTARPLHGRP